MSDFTETERNVFEAFSGYPPVLTAEQVAELLALSSPEVRRLTREGVLPGKRIGKSYRYFRDDVVRWLDTQPSASSD